MKKNLTELVFIIDRSGSMHGLKADTLGGFNSMLEKQKHSEGHAYVSTVLFNDHCQVIHDRRNVMKVEPLTFEQYQVGGCTALLDAIGIAEDRAVKYCCDSEGTRLNYEEVGKAVQSLRAGHGIAKGWKRNIEADEAARGRR